MLENIWLLKTYRVPNAYWFNFYNYPINKTIINYNFIDELAQSLRDLITCPMLIAGLKSSYIRILEWLGIINLPNSLSLPNFIFIVCERNNDRGSQWRNRVQNLIMLPVSLKISLLSRDYGKSISMKEYFSWGESQFKH